VYRAGIGEPEVTLTVAWFTMALRTSVPAEIGARGIAELALASDISGRVIL
jgi:hypothetical protein